MLGAVIGIEIPLSRVIGSWKTSQNRSAADRATIAAGLRASGDAGCGGDGGAGGRIKPGSAGATRVAMPFRLLIYWPMYF